MTDYLYRWCQFCQGKTRILLPPSPDKRAGVLTAGPSTTFVSRTTPINTNGSCVNIPSDPRKRTLLA